MSTFHTVADIDDLPLNRAKLIMLEGRELLACRTNEGVYVVENKCSHQDKPLADGRVRNGYIFCPFHGMRYKLDTGEAIGQLSRIPLNTFECREIDGKLQVSLPG